MYGMMWLPKSVAARFFLCISSKTSLSVSAAITLMNVLTKAEVLAADKLFATLDTRTRRWQLPSWGPVLLSDTVGFIRDLPHRLITSFKATLEEARTADLLLHVADASSPQVFEQISAVYNVLEELEIDQKDTLLVLNKIDRVTSAAQLQSLLNRYPQAIPISAQTGEGLDRLADVVSRALSRGFQDVDVEMPISNGRLLAFLSEHGEVLSRRCTDERMTVHCRIPEPDRSGYSEVIKRHISVHGRADQGHLIARIDPELTGKIIAQQYLIRLGRHVSSHQ